MPRKKQEPQFIVTYSEECVSPERFWEGYNALIKMLVDYYISKNDEDE